MIIVNIEGLKKEDVLRSLYNNAKVQGLGVLQMKIGDMTESEATRIINHCKESGVFYFDYLHGRVMKIDLRSDIEFDERLYDRDNGEGSAQRVIDILRKNLEK